MPRPKRPSELLEMSISKQIRIALELYEHFEMRAVNESVKQGKIVQVQEVVTQALEADKLRYEKSTSEEATIVAKEKKPKAKPKRAPAPKKQNTQIVK